MNRILRHKGHKKFVQSNISIISSLLKKKIPGQIPIYRMIWEMNITIIEKTLEFDSDIENRICFRGRYIDI